MSLSERAIDAERLDVLLAAARISDVAERHPELFDATIRAPAIRMRAAFWAGGYLCASIADHLFLGHRVHIDFLLGMLLVATFVYFDPPPILVARKLKASVDRSPSGPKRRRWFGAKHESAVPKADAQTQSGPSQ